MARSVSVKYGGKNVKLVASFGAARDICDRVHDLLDLFNDQQRAMLFLQMGRDYTPKFSWDMGKVSDVIAIGLERAGVDADQEGVGAFMVGLGLDKSQKVAQDYLSLFFAEPENTPEKEDKAGGGGPGK